MQIIEKIKSEAKRIEEDSLYSSKGHFYAAQRWESISFWLGIVSTIFSAIAGTSALSQFDYHNLLAGALSILVACLAGANTFIRPESRASIHRKFGNKYNSLKNEARIFHQIECDNKDEKNAAKYLQKLNSKRSKLNLDAPQIPTWAFEKARKGIESGEASYLIDKP